MIGVITMALLPSKTLVTTPATDRGKFPIYLRHRRLYSIVLKPASLSRSAASKVKIKHTKDDRSPLTQCPAEQFKPEQAFLRCSTLPLSFLLLSCRSVQIARKALPLSSQPTCAVVNHTNKQFQMLVGRSSFQGMVRVQILRARSQLRVLHRQY